MRAYIALLLLISLWSCQRNEQIQNQNTNPMVLRKTVGRVVNNNDSVVTTYSHNVDNKVVLRTKVDGGYSESYRIIRNSSGVIQQSIYKNTGLADSSVGNLFFNTSLGRYAYRIKYSQNFYDSTVFTYNARGQVIGENSFIKTSPTSAYAPSWKQEFAYVGDNVAETKVYTYDSFSGSYSHLHSMKYLYDQKISPRKLSDLFFAEFGSNDYISVNNVVKHWTEPANSTGPYDTVFTAYTYNTSNLPATSTLTRVSRGTTPIISYTFYY